ncbi:hypothetical protein BCL69_10944 [Nitrosomonas communis]|uniref:Uncharacterized protein n=1 Tax=Nitrosomonas communis TaxID=44574 RepID=A0A5D3Y880_9PROT|nr:hypothetical protein BCL69_10944 [Nitrosomonas communis]
MKNQIYLDDDFVNDIQRKLGPEQSLKDIPRKQKQAPIKPLSYFADHYKSRDESMAQAFSSGHYPLAQVREYFGISYAIVSRAVKQAKKTGMSNASSDPKILHKLFQS